MNHFTNACDIEFLQLNAVRDVNGRWIVPTIFAMVFGVIGILVNIGSNIAMALCFGGAFAVSARSV